MLLDPIEEAIVLDNAAEVQKYFDKRSTFGENLVKTDEGFELLLFAVEKNSLETLKVILSHEKFTSDSNFVTYFELAFLKACEEGQLPMVEFFTKACKSEPKLNIDWERLFKRSVGDCHLEIVKYFIELGCQISPWEKECLELGARCGDLDFVNRILGLCLVPVTSFGSGYKSAAKHGHLHIVQRLDQKYYATKLSNSFGTEDVADTFLPARKASMLAASEKGHFDVVQYLYNEFDLTDCTTEAFIRAANGNHSQLMEFFMDKGADINFNDGIVLSFCASNGNLQMIKKLVDLGVPYQHRLEDLFRFAVYNSDTAMIEYAAARLQTMDFMDKEQTFVELVVRGNLKMLEHCVKHFVTDITKCTIELLEFAISRDNSEIIDFILKGQNLEMNRETDFILNWAVICGSLSALKSLIRNNFFSSDGKYHKLLLKAIKHKQEAVAKFLVEKLLSPTDVLNAYNTIETSKIQEKWHPKALRILRRIIDSEP
jgi:hypothetical protein